MLHKKNNGPFCEASQAIRPFSASLKADILLRDSFPSNDYYFQNQTDIYILEDWVAVISLRTKMARYQKRILLTQVVVALLISAGLAEVEDHLVGYSFALGSVLPMIANLVVARALLPTSQGFMPQHVIKRFYRAEALKYVLTLILMMVFFAFIPLSGFAFFVGLLVSYVTFGFAVCFLSHPTLSYSEQGEGHS